MRIEELTLDEWESALPSSGFEVFHLPEALGALRDHVGDRELRLYGGFKGDNPVALFPLFVRSGPLSTKVVSSPPPGMHVPHLGPVVTPSSPKQRKVEKVNREFAQGVMEEVGVDDRTLVFVICSPGYGDPRPFEWDGQKVEVSFTYEVPVDGQTPEEILGTFTRSRRREIRDSDDLDLVVRRGDLRDAREVYRQTSRRFEEQDESFDLTWDYVRDVVTALDDRSRVYVARTPNGRLLSGIIVLYSNDAASFWLGGVRETYEGTSVNSLLHWEIIHDVATDPPIESVDRYDMVGAGHYRLSKYKSKFGPNLRPYYVVKSNGLKMSVAEAAYNARDRIDSVI